VGSQSGEKGESEISKRLRTNKSDRKDPEHRVFRLKCRDYGPFNSDYY
jgi:hypothetical protein